MVFSCESFWIGVGFVYLFECDLVIELWIVGLVNVVDGVVIEEVV